MPATDPQEIAMNTLPRRQQVALAALRLATAEAPGTFVGFSDIAVAARVLARQRPLTEAQLRSALARLVVAGSVERVEFRGMGGAVQSWRTLA